MGKWSKGAEAFALKHTMEIVEKYKRMKARKGSQVSTPAMSSIDVKAKMAKRLLPAVASARHG